MSYLYWITVLGVGALLAFTYGLFFIFLCYGAGFLITAVLLKRHKVQPGLHWGHSPLGQSIIGIGWIYWSIYTYTAYPDDLSLPFIVVLFLFIIAGSLAGYKARKKMRNRI